MTINAFGGSLDGVMGGSGGGRTSTNYDWFTGNKLNINNTTGTITDVGLFEFINFGPGVTNAGIDNLSLFDGQDVKLNVGSGESADFSGVIGKIVEGNYDGAAGSITRAFPLHG